MHSVILCTCEKKIHQGFVTDNVSEKNKKNKNKHKNHPNENKKVYYINALHCCFNFANLCINLFAVA